MHSGASSGSYDAHYYATACGRPYRRDEEWLGFFTSIADRIVRDIRPSTVLDVGCAMGFLVEALRHREVEAFGVDISEYAIQRVHPDIQAYCWVGSVTDPLPQSYDLIVCIEVLEHLSSREAEQAISNLCRYTGDVLFTSTPIDFKEATHRNVQPPEYWAELFARSEFFRDVDFDASFVTPWAARFRRARDPVARVVADYERRLWRLTQENQAQRELCAEQRSELASGEREAQALRAQIAEGEQALEALRAQALHSLDDQVRGLTAELSNWETRMSLLERSIGWTLLRRAQLVRLNLAPPGSRRELLFLRLAAVIQIWDREGFRSMVRRVYRRLLGGRWESVVLSESSGYSYDHWIRDREPSSQDLDRQRQRSRELVDAPLISVITPVFNPPADVLRDTIESVLNQTYSHWQLCIADGGSNIADVAQVLDEFTGKDSRISVKRLGRNLGIAGNTNEALEMAQGEYVVVLDHDDLLSPDMLSEVADILGQHPETDIIYYDEDKISEDGATRSAPWFKPDGLSPSLLLSVNYLMHSVIRRSLLVEIGSFDPAMDGAQDWDVALRCTERTDRIAHIPKVLYHWRQVQGSAARDANAKPWAHEAQARCVQAHLERLGIRGTKIVFPSLGAPRVLWPAMRAKVSIIIPTRDNLELLRACLSSLFTRTDYPDYEVILVDTGSTSAETLAYYSELEASFGVQVVEFAGPFNYSAANNLGALHSSGDLLLFLNNDTEVLDADWLREMVGWTVRPEIGIVGSKLLRPDGTIQHAGIVMGIEGHGSHIFDGECEQHYGIYGSTEWYRDYMAVTGACMAIRRSVFEELGGFDEGYQVGYSDIELCLRAVAGGYRVVYTPFARVLHHEGGTRGLSVPPNDVLRAYSRMLDTALAGDPYYNPNLSYANRRPTLARPHEESRGDRLLRILADFGLVERHGASSHPGSRALFSSSSQSGSDGSRPPSHLGQQLLLVTHDLSLSGAPLILYKLARYLVSNGYSVTILSPIDGPLRGLLSQAGISVLIDADALSDARVVFSHLRDFSAVVANTILAWRAVYAARAAQKPCAWWIHESAFGRELAEDDGNIALALPAADVVIFGSQATAASYAELSAAHNFTAIHIGVDFEPLGEFDPPFRSEPNGLRVVNVGSIEPRKGQDILLQAIMALPPDVLEATEVYLVGRILDQRFYRGVSRMARSLGNVHFVGEVLPEQALSYIRAADVFVLASRDEVLPQTILEAMCCGRGIIATDVGGIPEVIEHGVSGLIVGVEDHQGLADGLIRLFRDRDLLREIGDNAMDRYRCHLTMARFGDEMIQVIRRITGASVEA